MSILTYNESDFLMDGKPIRILSGAIHYFRTVPEYWEDRLKKLKACGLNTVETYVCWSYHEKKEGEFDFSGGNDLARFIRIAQDLGLYVIVRPGPYICAETDFGGLPAWLLTYKGMRIRTADPVYMSKAKIFLKEVFDQIRPYLSSNGGNLIALQIENEYGSYGSDKVYMQSLLDFYLECGMDCMLFTSDGGCHSLLTGGRVGNLLQMLNFGSNSKGNMEALRMHRTDHPFMCCEFWHGWFDHWYEEHHTRSAEDVRKEVEQLLDIGGSINMYMFHGGTNFGFSNGANEFDVYQPTITSYDYDSILNECGDMTPKFDMLKELLEKHFGKAPEVEVQNVKKMTYGEVELTEQALLLDQLDGISTPTHAPYTMSMEELGQNYGFVVYSTVIEGPIEDITLSIDGLHDRAHIFVNGVLQGIKERTGKRDDEVRICLGFGETAKVQILVENMGRSNYGNKIWHEKGITKGVLLGLRYEADWTMYPLPCEDLTTLKFEKAEDAKAAKTDTPVFLRGTFSITEKADTFLRLDGFTKGVAFINGFNLGRYWIPAGPQKTLYIPAPLLKDGENELIILELDGRDRNTVLLTDTMDLG